MPGLSAGLSRFGDDDGSADPAVAAALAAFSSGRGSEHDAVMSLVPSRLLVPIVAVVADVVTGGAGGGKVSEMSIPTLIGHDGRRAVPAFTSLDTLRLWRQEARQVPTGAADVWAAAVADDCAVVVDVAGPVPLAIDGARLAALAGGRPVPPPQEDPDVLAAVRAAAAGQAGVTGLSLADGAAGSDLMVALSVTPGLPAAAAEQLAGVIAEQVMARLGGRLRRGISVAVDVQAPPGGRERPRGQD